jgi:hypothetical protein
MMNPLMEFGKLLLALGILLVVVGVVLVFAPKIPLLGRLPGDIVIRKEHFSFYFPLTTSILLSIIISLLFYLFRK